MTGRLFLPEGVGTGPQWLDPASLPDDLRWIGYNENSTGTLNNDNVDDWVTFRGTAGDIITACACLPAAAGIWTRT